MLSGPVVDSPALIKMEKYTAIEAIGQGSYGTVYKAVTNSSNQIVALKVITKRKKSSKEIQNLRQEFEIQRTLCHPNIIRMLESFETPENIVVVTEFAPQDLSQILREKGHLSEECVRSTVCDLLSALYYLHFHRVLHRDLKPQNILVETDGTAKLCDFGFARSMSMDTYVLMSIKGTPLYMAPEIIEHCPYDHSADLWSLGCIVYECLVGSPPYYTNALIRLVNLMQEEIKWPTFVSSDCLSFLQGLLQKDPSQRLSWPNLLHHPFVDFSKINLANIPSNVAVVVPLTHPLTASQALAREKQKKDLICHVAGKPRKYVESAKYLEQQENKHKVKQALQLHPKARVSVASPEQQDLSDYGASAKYNQNYSKGTSGINSANQTDTTLAQMPNAIELLKVTATASVQTSDPYQESQDADLTCIIKNSSEEKLKKCSSPFNADKTLSRESDRNHHQPPKASGQSLLSWMSEDKHQPIECDEWLVFLQKTMEEVMEGEADVMTQENFVAMLVAPLRNPHASSKVIEYVANLLSLPFVVCGVTDKVQDRIKDVYRIVKAVPNLFYASKILAQQRMSDSDVKADDMQSLRPVSNLGADELHAMECIYLLLCNLIHMSEHFLAQFCDTVLMLDGIALLQQLLLLGRRKPRIVADLLAILAHILRILPDDYTKLVEQSVLGSAQDEKGKDICRLLTNKCDLLRSRCCHLLKLLGHYSCPALQSAWSAQLRSDLENLLSDSSDLVREAAEEAVRKLKGLTFYEAESCLKR